MTKLEEILAKAKALPECSGCYLMKDDKKVIIYVGKAKNLKKRVLSYFQKTLKDQKTELLIKKIDDFDFMVTATEVEALILENNLIKKYSPKYNIRLKDDKTYPYIVVDYNEPFPRPVITRKFTKKKNILILGPFPDASNLKEIINILWRTFKLRDCSVSEFARRKSPCLLYQMNYCDAPCVSKIGKEEYDKNLKEVVDFLKGKTKKVLSVIQERMERLAEEEKFEHALLLRDYLYSLQKFTRRGEQNAEISQERNLHLDVWAYRFFEGQIDLVVNMIRNGILIGHKSYYYPLNFLGEEWENGVLSFLIQYYSGTKEILPEKIVLDLSDDKRRNLEEALNLGQGISFLPKKDFTSLWKITYQQVLENFRVREKKSSFMDQAFRSLEKLLLLPEIRIIECYDVAIWQGKSPAGSQVVFGSLGPQKKDYRYYKLKERPEGNNDFQMLEELLERRVKRKETLPDLMIVDGGKGQVRSVKNVLKKHDLQIPVVGVIKAKNQKGDNKEEKLIIDRRKEPFILNNDKNLFRLITQIRDEAHRFSQKLHHKSEKSRYMDSIFDGIKGIGEITKKKMLKNLDCSLEDLKKLKINELANKFDISVAQAESLKERIKLLLNELEK